MFSWSCLLAISMSSFSSSGSPFMYVLDLDLQEGPPTSHLHHPSGFQQIFLKNFWVLTPFIFLSIILILVDPAWTLWQWSALPVVFSVMTHAASKSFWSYVWMVQHLKRRSRHCGKHQCTPVMKGLKAAHGTISNQLGGTAGIVII